MKTFLPGLLTICFLWSCTGNKSNAEEESKVFSGNPIIEGWYADPEGAVFDSTFWVFPTYSNEYDRQVFFDAYSSKDLVTWKKHARVLDTSRVSWAHRAMWAPAIIEKDNRYFLFFSANDLQKPGGPLWDENNPNNHQGGIGVAVSNSPEGPFEDYLGKPLISEFFNEAQPIDQFVFHDHGTYYIIYGGWGHCNIGILNDDFTGIIPWDSTQVFKEITPEGYVEGPFMFKRKGSYYFMWSEGGWGNDTYKVAYATADQATGPFKRIGTILESDTTVATGAGHNSAINIPGTDEWIMVYHRRPIPNEGRDHRVTSLDRLVFNEDGTIQQVKMTFEGVQQWKGSKR